MHRWGRFCISAEWGELCRRQLSRRDLCFLDFSLNELTKDLAYPQSLILHQRLECLFFGCGHPTGKQALSIRSHA
jgi:hypothetical protein